MKVRNVALITLGIFTVGLAGILMLAPRPRVSASPPLHGTPDPNATPHHPEDTLTGDTPTYYQHIEPIIEANCMTCHSEGNIGYESFQINGYQALVDHLEDVAFYVSIGYMPPWPPSDLSPAFKYDRSLTNAEIATFVAWAEAGAPLGDPSQRVTSDDVPETNVPTLEHDVTVEMPVAYTPDRTLTDDYRCFLIDPRFTEDGFVTGHNVIPGDARIVHHVIAYQVLAEARSEAERKEAADGRPGWQCFGGTNLASGNSLSTMIGSWTPGSVPTVHEEGTGIPVEAGNLIVLQVHYNTLAGIFADQTQLVLQMADDPANTRPMFTVPILAPVEIPCPEGAEGVECERWWAISDADSDTNTGLLARCGASLSDYEDQDASHLTSTCDLVTPISGYVMSVLGHMHELGTSTRLERNPGEPDAQVLLDIPDWDFHWQGSYQLEEPVRIEVADTIRLTCVWDNSEGDRYVVWGERTQDEMCLNFVLFLPDEQFLNR